MATAQTMYRLSHDSDAWVILHLGVGRKANELRERMKRRGVECYSCGRDVFRFDGDADFREAAGCRLCVECYTDAGFENEHSDGYHDAAPAAGCPVCAADAETDF